MTKTTIGALSLSLALFQAARAETPPDGGASAGKKALMASMGDSITAALFAGTNHVSLNGDDLTPDDIEQGFMGSRIFEKKYTLSWSSGKDIPSHFMRLREYLKAVEGKDLEVLNTATTGNKAEALVVQARTVADAMKGGKYSALRYVTILIGANDICFGGPTGTPDGVMRDSLKAALGILAGIPQEEPVKVLVAAIPDVAALGSKDIKDSHFWRDMTCGMLWAKLAICQPIVAWQGPEEYQARRRLIEGKNDAIRRALMEVGAEHANLDIAFSERTFRESYESKDLAADCFHPNQATQTRMAVELWKEQPWFPPAENRALLRNRAGLDSARDAVAVRLEDRPWGSEPGPGAVDSR